jgi:cobalamin biosynthesis protein CobT
MKEEFVNGQFMDGLKAAVDRDAPLEEIVDLLRRERDAGLSAHSAYELLNAFRATADHDEEDRILEVMDVVMGFCSPHLRVWHTTH